MGYWIFANLDRLGDVSTLGIKAADTLVFMNTAMPVFMSRSLARHRRKILYRREDRDTKMYWGDDAYEQFHDYVSVRWLDSITYNSIVPYPKPKLPTTGFLVYHLLLEHNPVLVNFVGPKLDNKAHWDNHDWDYEMKYYKTNKVPMVNCL